MSNEYNEVAYRDARARINPTPCMFEKAILSTCVACSLAEKHLLAERETSNCSDSAARQTCLHLLEALLSHSAFALKITAADATIPHNKALKAQCGGLLGLQRALDGVAAVTDVHRLVNLALQQYGSIEALPYGAIVQFVAGFSMRQRGPGK